MADSNVGLDLDRERPGNETQARESDLIVDRQINEYLARIIRKGVPYSQIHAALRNKKNECKEDLLESLKMLLDQTLQTEPRIEFSLTDVQEVAQDGSVESNK